MMERPDRCERYIGVLLGGCIGDILGSTNEGKTFDSIRATEMVTKFHTNTYTDDTELTLVLARYLALNHDDEIHLIAQKVHEMYRDIVTTSNRSYSSNTRCILTNWSRCMLAGSSDTNGSIMRIAPMALINCKSDRKLYDKIKLVMLCTHGESKNAVDASFIHVKILRGIINQRCTTPESIHKYAMELAQRVRNPTLYAYLQMIHHENKKRFEETNWNITKSIFGYDLFQIKAIDCFICAFACFLYNFANPEKALIMAANLGGDTDTIAKVVGDLVGAMYGTKWIPEKWQDPEGRDELVLLAKILYERG